MKTSQNQTAHTPGPWTSSGTSVYGADGEPLNLASRPLAERTANIELQACAPELLAALESAMDRLEGFTHRIGFPLDDKRSLIDAMSSTATEAREEIKAIRAAIAKVKGVQS